MTPRDLTSMGKHGTKTALVFLPADKEASLLLLPSSVSLLSGGALQPENTYSCIFKVTGQIWESQKRKSINTNHSYHQCSSPSASLNWSNNKAWFSFNQSNGCASIENEFFEITLMEDYWNNWLQIKSIDLTNDT